MLAIIAAMDENQLIGVNNRLPWHLPDDLKYFKALTLGNSIIMGRKTFESIGKPLKNRENIVVSSRLESQANITIASSLTQALEKAKCSKTFIIGGKQLFEEGLPLAQYLFLTRIEASLAGDTYFPPLSIDDWQLTHQQPHPKDKLHPYSFTFFTFTRKTP
jgi:dihydrofolate reductase